MKLKDLETAKELATTLKAVRDTIHKANQPSFGRSRKAGKVAVVEFDGDDSLDGELCAAPVPVADLTEFLRGQEAKHVEALKKLGVEE